MGRHLRLADSEIIFPSTGGAPVPRRRIVFSPVHGSLPSKARVEKGGGKEVGEGADFMREAGVVLPAPDGLPTDTQVAGDPGDGGAVSEKVCGGELAGGEG